MKKLILLLFAAVGLHGQIVVPPAASQVEVDAGTVRNKYVSPFTLASWSGGSSAWGSITGTLSSQTDLQTALNLKANLISPSFTTPTIGVASGTSLTLSSLTTTRVPFSTTAGLLTDSAAFTFNSGTGTLSATQFAGGGAGVTGVNAATLGGATFAAPGAIGGGTPSTGAFTSLTTTGGITTGVGGSTAGVLELGQGTAPADGTTSVKIYAAAGVTSYKRLLPASVGSSGYTYQTVSGTTQTESQVTDATLATNVRATIVEKIATFSVDGGGSAIATGTVAGTARIPFACTLTGYSITATAATGTNTIKIWLKATATSIPVIGDAINTSGVSLTTGTAVASATLSDFTDTVYAAGDMARCAITAVDGTATDLTVTLYGTRL